MIIGLIGGKGVGKDTLGGILSDLLPSYETVAFADPLKEICSCITNTKIGNWYDQNMKNQKLKFPWEDYTYRIFMQKLGTDVMRKHLRDSVWIDCLFSRHQKKKDLIITDIRFNDEARAVILRGGITILVSRELDNKDPHESEVLDIDPDYINVIIDNNGTISDLKLSAQTFVNEILNGGVQ